MVEVASVRRRRPKRRRSSHLDAVMVPGSAGRDPAADLRPRAAFRRSCRTPAADPPPTRGSGTTICAVSEARGHLPASGLPRTRATTRLRSPSGRSRCLASASERAGLAIEPATAIFRIPNGLVNPGSSGTMGRDLVRGRKCGEGMSIAVRTVHNSPWPTTGSYRRPPLTSRGTSVRPGTARCRGCNHLGATGGRRRIRSHLDYRRLSRVSHADARRSRLTRTGSRHRSPHPCAGVPVELALYAVTRAPLSAVTVIRPGVPGVRLKLFDVHGSAPVEI